jgi:hypothetical protein
LGAVVTELANANEAVRGSINNIKEKRLSILIESKPICETYLYYNPETKNFAIEDPALFYYLKHLDWERLKRDCGYAELTADDQLRQTTFLGWRDDKKAQELVLEEPRTGPA